jgi:hypothetical protein
LISEAQAPDVGVRQGKVSVNDQAASPLHSALAGYRLDSNAGPILGDLYLAGTETQCLAQAPRNYHSACPINGCAHTIVLP